MLNLVKVPPYLGESPKKSKKTTDKKTTYFLSMHNISEYFAFEILNKIGFNTPKIRLVPSLASNSPVIAAKSIENYIPIAAYVHERSYDDSDDIVQRYLEKYASLKEIHRKYKLDMEKQVVIDLDTKKEYKISGNLFATDIGANLVCDRDFQPEEFNVGLVKRGNRFVAFLIDKDDINLDGENYDVHVVNGDKRIAKSNLYKNANKDQVLYILNEIKNALEKDDFSKIFVNKRIVEAIKTFILQEDVEEQLKIFSNTFKKTAQSALVYFTTKYDLQNEVELLATFNEREEIRNIIADSIMEELALNENDREPFKQIILEDLRAPYYKNLFANKDCITHLDLDNGELKDAVLQDITQELMELGVELGSPNKLHLTL